MSILVFLCMGFLSLAAAQTPDPPYKTAPTCGATGRTCITDEAECVGDKCVCQPPYSWGKGDFRCYEDSTLACELKNDPSLTTFHGESEGFPFPCRYLVSHVRQNMIKHSTGEIIGTCEAMVFAVNTKAKGKLYVSNYDVGIKLTYNNPHRVVQSTFRQIAFNSDGHNIAWSYGKNGRFSPISANGNDDINYSDLANGVRVHQYWDQENNRHNYEVQGCGIKITLVSFDTFQKLSQKQVPGLSVAVSKLHNPTFLSQNLVTCLPPPAYGGASIQSLQETDLTQERSMLLRAFKAGYTQSQFFQDRGYCSAIGTTLRNCQVARQRNAMRKCDWILKKAHFMKCYDTSPAAVKSLILFKYCVDAWCTNRPCPTAIQEVNASGCADVGDVPEVQAFMAGNMCPQDPAAQR